MVPAIQRQFLPWDPVGTRRVLPLGRLVSPTKSRACALAHGLRIIPRVIRTTGEPWGKMDVFSALQTSVSGLQAQAFSLGNISGNIANSQTVGYKRIDTDFPTCWSSSPPSSKRRRGRGLLAADQQPAGRRDGHGCPDQHGTQRRRLLHRADRGRHARRTPTSRAPASIPAAAISRSIAAATSSTAPAPT